MGRFEMTDIGNALKVLGMNVTHYLEKGTITIDQSYYAENVVECAGMKDGNPVFTLGAAQNRNFRSTNRIIVFRTRKASGGSSESHAPSCTSHRSPGMTSFTL